MLCQVLPLLLLAATASAADSSYWDISVRGGVVGQAASNGLSALPRAWSSIPAPPSSAWLTEAFSASTVVWGTHTATASPSAAASLDAPATASAAAAASASPAQTPPEGATPTATGTAATPTATGSAATASLSASSSLAATATATATAAFPLPAVVTALSNLQTLTVLLGLSDALTARGLSIVRVALQLIAVLGQSPVRRQRQLYNFSEVSQDALDGLQGLVDLSTCSLPDCLYKLQAQLARVACANENVITLVQEQCGLQPLRRRLAAAELPSSLRATRTPSGALSLSSSLGDSGAWYDVAAPPRSDLGLSAYGVAWTTVRLRQLRLILTSMNALTLNALAAATQALLLLAEIGALLGEGAGAGGLLSPAAAARRALQGTPGDLPALVAQLIAVTRTLQGLVVNLATAQAMFMAVTFQDVYAVA